MNSLNMANQWIGFFFGGMSLGLALGYCVWARREWPSFPRRRTGQVPPRQSPPAPPTPYTSWAAILKERERCAQLAESMDCAWRCRVGQEVGAAIRRQGRWPGQPDPNPRGGSYC